MIRDITKVLWDIITGDGTALGDHASLGMTVRIVKQRRVVE